MPLVAEFEVTCEGLPFVAVAAAVPSATIHVEMIPYGEGTRRFLAHVIHDDHAEIERTFASSTFVGSYSVVGEAGDTRQYKVHPGPSKEDHLGEYVTDLEGLEALTTTESRIDRIRVTPTGWIYDGWFADRDVFDAFRTFWQTPGNGNGFTLHRLARAEDGSAATDGPDDGLTDDQREAVRLAHEMGYFDIPRTASLADVAAELDISPSSCSERLRRAQGELVETHVDLDRRRGPGLKSPSQ